MSNEQIKEFIKSFSFGMSAEEIADVEEVSVDDINRQITWNKEKYGDM